jgi:hypothetical protein
LSALQFLNPAIVGGIEGIYETENSAEKKNQPALRFRDFSKPPVGGLRKRAAMVPCYERDKPQLVGGEPERRFESADHPRGSSVMIACIRPAADVVQDGSSIQPALPERASGDLVARCGLEHPEVFEVDRGSKGGKLASGIQRFLQASNRVGPVQAGAQVRIANFGNQPGQVVIGQSRVVLQGQGQPGSPAAWQESFHPAAQLRARQRLIGWLAGPEPAGLARGLLLLPAFSVALLVVNLVLRAKRRAVLDAPSLSA